VIPGKKLTPEDLLWTAWRQKWLIVVPFVLVMAATIAFSRSLPDRYRSETLILVVPQRVPESYVRSTVTTRIEDRLQSISQQILSRTRLERIIQDFNLYTNEIRTGIMEDIVDRMRRDIDVQTVKGDAFKVAFTGREPRTVMRVTERLASLFIDESLRDRELLAEGTNQFLEAQLEDARRQLVDHERTLEAYRRKFDGQLPKQVDANLQMIRSSELQLQALNDSLNRDRDQRAVLERQISDATAADSESAPVHAADKASDNGVGGGTAAQQLASAKAALGQLQLRLTPEHPDVIRMRRTVRELEAKVETESLEQPLSPVAVTSPAERARFNRVRELHALRDEIDRQILAKQNEDKRLKAVISEYQARVAAAPTREAELTEITRDYETLQHTYTSLLSKKEESKIAANLERRQIGEQFKVLDPARLAEKPTSPNRLWINAAGAIGGLALGIAIVGLLEYRDTTLRNETDVVFALGLPVLGCVPRMVTSVERRRRLRRRVIAGALTATGAATAMVILVIWKLRP
jgi:polysaccharide chain length determinant protein (PEP-CTERM system associated)